MTEPEDTVSPPMHPTRGGRIILLVIVLIALLGTVLYALRVPVERQVRRRFDHAADLQPPPAPIPDPLADMIGRLHALQAELDQTRARVAALEQRASIPSTQPFALTPPGPMGTGDAMVVALSTRMDGLAARQDRLEAQQAAGAAGVEAAANQAVAVGALTDRTARLARIQAAEAALAAGLPLGDLPGAAPALARFRADAPPTEAALRLAFPAAAAQARAASRPTTANLGFWAAARARATALITIRRGDTLLLGSAELSVIDGARAALDAGDLAGAVTTLAALQGPTAATMADWQARAQALLAARAALARLAAAS